MEFIYDDRNPPGFVLDDGLVLDNGLNSFPLQTNVSLLPSNYEFVVPGFGPTDPFYMPIDDRLYPFRDMTSKIIYLWKNLDPNEKEYIIKKSKHKTFYPRDDIFYDPYINYGWDNLYRFWYMDGNYIDDIYLNDDGWAVLVSLYHYLEQKADKNLVDRVKKECCTRDKHIAEAIWDVASTKVKNTTKKENLETAEINNIKSKFKSLSSSTIDPSDKDIYEIYKYMWECYKRKETKTTGSFKIEDFLKEVVKDGIENASKNYKKYLFLKKKYFDKKTLKKL